MQNTFYIIHKHIIYRYLYTHWESFFNHKQLRNTEKTGITNIGYVNLIKITQALEYIKAILANKVQALKLR